MKLISKIKRKANFPIEIDIITVDELKYKFGKEKMPTNKSSDYLFNKLNWA